MSKLGLFIPRPNRKFRSASGNAYIKIDGKVCMIDAEALENWDSIENIQVDSVDYDHSMLPSDEPNNPTGEPFSRLEITDYQTFGRNDKLAVIAAEREVRKATYLKTAVIADKAAAEELA